MRPPWNPSARHRHHDLPAPVGSPRIDTVEQDDRRWLWLAVLVLLALETWMRRAQPTAVERRAEEHARVA